MKLKNILSTSSLILISSAVYAQYDTVVMCRACPAGTRGDGSDTKCTNCGPGTYQDKVGQDSCINCGKGKYQNATGQTGCKNCGKGYYCPNEKTENRVPVDTGYCAKTDKESAQTACASNTSSSYPGVKTCNKETCAATSCNDGYYLTGTTCTKCEAGYYCKNSTRNDCGKGKYSEAGWSECKACKAATGFGSWYNRDYSSYGTSCGNIRRQATAYCNGNNSTKIDADPYTSYEDKTLTCSGSTYCDKGSCYGCNSFNNGSVSLHQDSTYSGGCTYECYSGYNQIDDKGCCKESAPSGSGGYIRGSDCHRGCSGYNKLEGDVCVPCYKPSHAHWKFTACSILSLGTDNCSCEYVCDKNWSGTNCDTCNLSCSAGKEQDTSSCSCKSCSNKKPDGADWTSGCSWSCPSDKPSTCTKKGIFGSEKTICVNTSCSSGYKWDSEDCSCKKD